ncbi:HdrB: CoB--CoM heterodisulfide reductase, iron-sulfur subunit beta [Desulfosarcina variabilis str. Montpellier]|uniref:CoB--CoM heterodisulfide reductase iron-sulfur subunit B family protein n=1 Tax=Desulfosarcina variabilis TaxID=2300 RepID=UPI003AFB5571
MSYLYYPGCSLTASAREYDLSTRATMHAVGQQLTEIDGWTCCGASAAAPISHLLSLCLGARNLALAEQMAPDSQILVPCSACYLNLKKAQDKLANDADSRDRINEALSAVALKASGQVKVRHLLDVLFVDLGANRLAAHVTRSLSGLTVAPYYGCQCLRPYVEFDDPEQPVSMQPLIEATGATVFDWDMGARCCGAALVSTQPDDGLKRVASILKAAKGADLIVTVCPMCQMNLDAWQAKASQTTGEDLAITVLYLPQLLGLAMGLTAEELGINMNLAVSGPFLESIAS